MNKKDNVFRVQMLGQFSITRNGISLGDGENRSRKVWTLIEYLIANRNKTVSQDALYEVLWGYDEESENPASALKNLVYRARKLLSVLVKGEKLDLIILDGNTYTFNKNIKIEVDAEVFESLIQEDENQSGELRIENLEKAVGLYKGEFLPKSSNCDWVVSKSVFYMTLYIKCIGSLSQLLWENEKFFQAVSICEKAVELYPLEETLHRFLLISYINSKENNKALNHFTKLADIFYKELGVNVSDSIRSLYPKIIDNINVVEKDICSIKESLQEFYGESGALYCEYEVFKNLYRAQASSIVRTGQAIQLALVTLTDIDGKTPSSETLKTSMGYLKDAILSSLRRGDTVSSYSTAQFVMLLPLTTYENCGIISKRIEENFKKLYKKNDVILNVTIRSVAPTENL